MTRTMGIFINYGYHVECEEWKFEPDPNGWEGGGKTEGQAPRSRRGI
jgi:hypothetical protein